MLLIRKNQNNTLILTLSEKKTLAAPVYLFRLINDLQKTETAFIMPDVSAYPDRYNKFTLTETSGSQIATSGTIELSPAGFYHYEVYEQTSTTNLDYMQALNPGSPLEIGKALVIGPPQSEYTRYEGQDNTFKAYTG